MRRSRPRVSDGRHRQRMVDVAESEQASRRMSLGHDDVLRWIRAFGTEVDANKEQLTQLDAAVGDGDHGINMQRGVSAVLVKVDAAGEGQDMRDTVPLVARKGRASYLGERSAGHQDPGATSSHLLLEAAAETWGEPEQTG